MHPRTHAGTASREAVIGLAIVDHWSGLRHTPYLLRRPPRTSNASATLMAPRLLLATAEPRRRAVELDPRDRNPLLRALKDPRVPQPSLDPRKLFVLVIL